MLDKLLEEREGRVSLITSLQQGALEGDHDLSEQDLEVITRAKDRITAIDRQVNVISDNLEMEDAVRDRIAALQPGSVEPTNLRYRYAGEVLYDLLHHADAQGPAHRERPRHPRA